LVLNELLSSGAEDWAAKITSMDKENAHKLYCLDIYREILI